MRWSLKCQHLNLRLRNPQMESRVLKILQSESQDKDVTRVIAWQPIFTRRFALGFDDGLYLWFDPVASQRRLNLSVKSREHPKKS